MRRQEGLQFAGAPLLGKTRIDFLATQALGCHPGLRDLGAEQL
jgi:hypothetical protein